MKYFIVNYTIDNGAFFDGYEEFSNPIGIFSTIENAKLCIAKIKSIIDPIDKILSGPYQDHSDLIRDSRDKYTDILPELIVCNFEYLIKGYITFDIKEFELDECLCGAVA